MANVNGWWKLEITNTDNDEQIELSMDDLGHIADLIQQGFTEGEIVNDQNEKEADED